MTVLSAPTAGSDDATVQLPPPDITWQRVCRVDDLVPERGAAALLHDGAAVTVQVALVRLLDDRVLAVDNHDPFSGANVISRGLVGWRRADEVAVPTIASPLHKQAFSLETGRCLDAAGKEPHAGASPDLRTFPVRVTDGVVEVGLPGASS